MTYIISFPKRSGRQVQGRLDYSGVRRRSRLEWARLYIYIALAFCSGVQCVNGIGASLFRAAIDDAILSLSFSFLNIYVYANYTCQVKLSVWDKGVVLNKIPRKLSWKFFHITNLCLYRLSFCHFCNLDLSRSNFASLLANLN